MGLGRASLASLLLLSSVAFAQDEGSAAAAETEAAGDEAPTDTASEEMPDEEASAAAPAQPPASEEKADETGPAAAKTAPASEGTNEPAAAAAEPAATGDAEGGFEDDGAEEFSDEDLGGGFDEVSDEPGVGERRLVAYVATGVAAAAFVTGGVFAFLAWQQYQCVADVVECNKTLDDPIVGEELFDARAEIEYKALAADMAFLFGAAAALVAGTGYVRGFLFTGEDDGADAAADEAVTLQGLPPLPRVAQPSTPHAPASPLAPLSQPSANALLSKGAGHE